MQHYSDFCCHIISILVISSVLNLKPHTSQGGNLRTVSPHTDHCWQFRCDHILKYIICMFCQYG